MTPINLKFVSRMADMEHAGNRKSTGREIWQAEYDGQQARECVVDIPAKVHHMKDQDKRAAKVRELAFTALS